MTFKHGLFFLWTLACTVLCVTSTRDSLMMKGSKSNHDLSARLQTTEGHPLECWPSLMELKSCSNEIAHYMMKGGANISPNCCCSVRVINHNCWPSMLTSFAHYLHRYCDANSSSPASAHAAHGIIISIKD